MQVTLTPRTEELLQQARARHPGRSPEQILEQLLDEQERRETAGTTEPTDPLWQRLKAVPGIGLPVHWPPRFAKFEPIRIEGEPVSEQLIRERR